MTNLKKIIRQTNLTDYFFLFGLLLLFNIKLFYFCARNDRYLILDDALIILLIQTGALVTGFIFLRLLPMSWENALKISTYALLIFHLLPLFGLMYLLSLLTGGLLGIIYFPAIVFLLLRLYRFAGFLSGHAYFRKAAPIFACILVSMQLPGMYSLATASQEAHTYNEVELFLKDKPLKQKPHILYIVPDRYANNNNLLKFYNFSNEKFTKALRDRGFYVWDNQYANYLKTFQSLASGLNIGYLDELMAQQGTDATSYQPIYSLVNNYQFQRILQKNQYFYTHAGSWWQPTANNAYANQNINTLDQFSESINNYLTLLTAVDLENLGYAKCERVERQKKAILQAVKQPEPQYIFWHLLTTHPPYIYHDDGSCREEEEYFEDSWAEREKAYLTHIQLTNELLLKMIDSLQKESARPLIIAIQSDEGPYPYRYMLEKDIYNFWNAPIEETDMKMGIFNALYLPSQNYENYDRQTTVINNTRLILNELYGPELALLDHSIYIFRDETAPYALKDVTDQLLGKDKEK